MGPLYALEGLPAVLAPGPALVAQDAPTGNALAQLRCLQLAQLLMHQRTQGGDAMMQAAASNDPSMFITALLFTEKYRCNRNIINRNYEM